MQTNPQERHRHLSYSNSMRCYVFTQCSIDKILILRTLRLKSVNNIGIKPY